SNNNNNNMLESARRDVGRWLRTCVRGEGVHLDLYTKLLCLLSLGWLYLYRTTKDEAEKATEIYTEIWTLGDAERDRLKQERDYVERVQKAVSEKKMAA
ncbi:unnamed protein product, partial [Mesorhabditis spiculigera]